MFKVTIPNRNYEELYLHPEKHYNDNKVGRVKQSETSDKTNKYKITDKPIVKGFLNGSTSIAVSIDKKDGELNGDVNRRVFNLNMRQMTIYSLVKNNPGLRTPQLLKLIRKHDPSITKNIL